MYYFIHYRAEGNGPRLVCRAIGRQFLTKVGAVYVLHDPIVLAAISIVLPLGNRFGEISFVTIQGYPMIAQVSIS